MGSLAMLLLRPGPFVGTETVNDADGFLANFWRAVRLDPAAVAEHADWPVNENDLHARHVWLREQRATLTRRLEGRPRFFDAKIAGWWVLGPVLLDRLGMVRRGPVGPVVRWSEVDGVPPARPPGRRRARGQPPARPPGQRRARGQPPARPPGRCRARGQPPTGPPGRCRARGQPQTGPPGRCRARRQATPGEGSTANGSGDAGRLLRGPVRPAPAGPGVLRRLDAGLRADTDRQAGVDRRLPRSALRRHGQADAIDSTARTASPSPTRSASGPSTTGATRKLRIALCGYAGEHDMPADWAEWAWKAKGGYGSQSKAHDNPNAKRERIWFSPHCLEP